MNVFDVLGPDPSIPEEITTPDEYVIDQNHINDLLKTRERVESIFTGKKSIRVVNNGDYPVMTSDLGNCRVYNQGNSKIYSIHHGEIDPIPADGLEMSLTDFIIVMHEYGHIILGHMNDDQTKPDSPYALVRELFDTINEDGVLLAEHIANNCGIDIELAQQLLTRLLDDPDLVHQLLNISMDMSVNTCVLNENDIHYIEQEITKKFKRINLWDTRKEKMVSNLEDMATVEFQKETKERLRKELERLRRRVMLKFILPSSYKLGVNDQGQDIPFPDGKAYYEYFRMIISHLDQFVKFLASLRLGKPQDQLSGADIANAMKQEQEEFEFKRGYRQALNDYHERLAGKSNKNVKDYPQESDQFISGYNKCIDDIAERLLNENEGGSNSLSGDSGDEEDDSDDQSCNGENDGEDDEDEDEDDDEDSDGNGNGSGDSEGDEGDGEGDKDHSTPAMDEFLKQMKDGTLGDPNDPECILNKGGKGRSTEEMPAVFRKVKIELDPLDQFLVKLGSAHRTTVNKIKPKRNVMYRRNRRIGSGRSKVIMPTIQMKLERDSEPRVVFLIDISGSMDTDLIDRVLKTISISLKKIGSKVRYDVITWNTSLATHYRDLDPRNPLTTFPCGGGTDLANGIRYYGLHYKKNSPLIVISDFEDSLQDWNNACNSLPGYKIYGINYGYRKSNVDWGNFEEFKFDGGKRGRW